MTDPVDRSLLEAELRARRDRASSPLDESVWSLTLGEAHAGVQAISRYLAEAAEDATGARRRAELALLVGDQDRTEREARVALRDDLSSYVAGYREYLGAMLALMADDEDQARTQLEALETFVDGHDRLRSGHPASIADIPRGLVARDADRVEAGIDALLGWHLRRARSRSEIFNSSRGVICLDAIVALLLAHRRQLTVPVAAQYRAARVPLLAIHLTEWQGEPLPRALPLSLEADLIAGGWLQGQGLGLEAPAATPAKQARHATRAPSRGPAIVEADVVRESLRLREAAGEGSAWQLASWALMLGDAERARAHLRREAAAAARRWREAIPQQSRAISWFRQAQGLPNRNHVREHFALALVLGDQDALADTGSLLGRWAEAVEDDQRRRGQPPYAEGRYGHASGYLDLLSALLRGKAPALTRSEAMTVAGPSSSIRVACVALVERDHERLTSSLDEMLAEHARTLERKSSPPSPVCEPAAHIAAAASRLGLPASADERYESHPVPITIRNLPGLDGRLGRLPCDLLGRAIWEGGR